MNEFASTVKTDVPHTDEILTHRLSAFTNRWEAIPVAGKKPLFKSWRKQEITEAWLRSITADRPDMRGCGARTGHAAVVDYDIPEPDLLEACHQAAVSVLGESPMRRVGRTGFAEPYFNADPIEKITVKGTKTLEDGTVITRKVEFLGRGQQFVIHGLHPDTGKPYRWTTPATPFNTPLDSITRVTDDDIHFAAAMVATVFESFGFEVKTKDSNTDGEARKSIGEPFTLEIFEAMCRRIDPGSFDRQGEGSWSSMAAAFRWSTIWDSGGEDLTYDERRELFVAWSRGDFWHGGQPSNWKSEEDASRLFDDMDKPPSGKSAAGPGTFVKLAIDGGYKGQTGVGLLDWFESLHPEDDQSESESSPPVAEEKSKADDFAVDESDAEDLFQVFSEDEGLEGPPLDWVIPGILPMGYQVMLYGEEQSLKTYVMLEMMECAMTGHRFAHVPGNEESGSPVVKSDLSAMLICGEGFEGVKKQRHPLWRKHHGIDDSKPLPFYTMNVMPSFLDRKAVEKLARSIKVKCGDKVPDLIGIDTLVYALAPDGKEDSNDDATKIYNAGKLLMRLLGKPLIIFWVHHVGHSAVRTRGAYNWKGSSDIRFRLEHVKPPVNDGNGGRSYHVRMVCEKLKDGPLPAPIEFKGRTVFGKDKDGNSISTVLLSGVPVGSLMDRHSIDSADSGDVPDADKLAVADVVRLVLDKADAGLKLSPGDVAKEADALGLLTGKAESFDRKLRHTLSKATADAVESRKPLDGLYTCRTMRTKDGPAPVYEFTGQGGQLGVWAPFEVRRQAEEVEDFGDGAQP